jgi:hypothetical protein
MSAAVATPAAAHPLTPEPITELQQLTDALYATLLVHTSPSARPIQDIVDRITDVILEDFDDEEPRDPTSRIIFRKARWATYRHGLLVSVEIIHRRFLTEKTEDFRDRLSTLLARVETDFRSILPAGPIPYAIYQTARDTLTCKG